MLDERFQIIGQLGCRSETTVYLCEDLTHRGRAVVKVLSVGDADIRQSFVKGATLLASRCEPHLVKVLNVGELRDGSPYIATEYLGEGLKGCTSKRKLLPWRAVVKAGAQIAYALDVLHRMGIIHRCVQPSNIVMTSREDSEWGPSVLLVDRIGLEDDRAKDAARVPSGGQESPRKGRKGGNIPSTHSFMPPEAGVRAPNSGFDVYGLGATMFQLCTGTLYNPLEPKSMREANAEATLPEELEAVVKRALTTDPEERTRSAKALLSELEVIGLSPYYKTGYEWAKSVGSGAKTELLRAYHEGTHQYALLKLLRKEHEGPEERAHLEREVRVLRVLRHGVIPVFVDARTSRRSENERDRPLYISMEHHLGERVADLGSEPMLQEEVTLVGIQLASALATMHAIGVIHRDLNRRNVLIERKEPRARDPRRVAVTLIGFGQAEIEDRFYEVADIRSYDRKPLGPLPQLSTGKLAKCTWSAPEVRKSGHWTTKSDIYSLGWLLYQLLTGKEPKKDARGRWISPATYVPESEGLLANAILGALAVDPKTRLDALSLGQKLQCVADGASEIQPEELCIQQNMLNTRSPAANQNPGDVPPFPMRGVAMVAIGIVLAFGLGWFGYSMANGRTAELGQRAGERDHAVLDGPANMQDSAELACLVGEPQIADELYFASAGEHANDANENTDPQSREHTGEQKLAGEEPSAGAHRAAGEQGKQDKTKTPRSAAEQPTVDASRLVRKRKHPAKKKKSTEFLPTREAAVVAPTEPKVELSLYRARDIAFSMGARRLEACLMPRQMAYVEVVVAAEGSIEKVSFASSPELRFLAKECLRVRLESIHFRSGDSATTHQKRIGSTAP